MLNEIKISNIEGKGRGLLANKNFKPGDVVIKEEPLAYVVMNAHAQTTCHYCLKISSFQGNETITLNKCTGCNFARYCDRECQKKAWKDHKGECKAIRCVSPGQPSDKTRIVGRILWKRLRKEAEETLVKIESLCNHLEERSKEDLKSLDDHVYDFGDFFGYDDLPEDEDLHKIFSVIDCNAIGINDNRGLQSIGVGIYPICSLLNHQCDPNCVAINNGKVLEVRAIKPLNVGDEMSICYVNYLLPKLERKEKLQSQYYFDCQCEMCCKDNNSDQLKEAMISESIKPESREYIINFSNSCLKRIQMSKDKENWERMSNQVLGALGQQDCVLDDTHYLKLAVLNHGVEVHSFLRQQSLAVSQAERIAEAYKRILPAINPTLGLFLMRLGILYWQTESNNKALETLKAAASILTVSTTFYVRL